MTKPVSALPFLAGAATALLVKTLLERKRADRDKRDAGATAAGDDLSLFYGDRRSLTTITERRRFLDAAVYGALVRDAVVCCVDVVLVRHNPARRRKECLLVERSSEPVKGVWWWPGGRLLKGETFFDAAKRKVQQEAGISNVECIQVLGVWNTFFPTSAWDNDDSQGTQTVNAIVLVKALPAAPSDDDDDGAPCTVQLDATSEAYRWIPLNAARAAADGEDPYVVAALRRLEAWNPGYVTA